MNAAGPLFRLSLSNLVSRPLRTALAVTAVAAGVAVVFAVLAIDASPAASFRAMERALGGDADLYVTARSQRGVGLTEAQRVAALRQVAAVAPVLQRLVRITGAHGGARVALVGLDERIDSFHPAAADPRITGAGAVSAIGVYLPARLARRLKLRTGDAIAVYTSTRIRRVLVAGVLGGRAGEALGEAPVVLAPLGLAERLTASSGRITHLVVRTNGDPRRAAPVIERAADGMMDAHSPGAEAKLFSSATMLERRAANLFALLTLVIGALLIYSVALLNAFDRRRDVAALRLIGAGPSTLILQAAAESFALGLASSAIGLVLGKTLLTVIAGNGPQYMASAFLISPASIVPTWLPPAVALAGTFCAVAGGTLPLVTSLRAPATARVDDAEEHRSISGIRGHARLVPPALALLGAGAALAIALPSLAYIGIAAVIAGGGMLMPALVGIAIRAGRRVAPTRGGAARVGQGELVNAPRRATALAAICAVCVGALVVIGGTAKNLEAGMASLASNMFDAGNLWISVGGQENNVGTEGFGQREIAAVRYVPGVATIHAYRLAFMDFGNRRVFVIGYAPGVARSLTGNEFVAGDRAALSRGLPDPNTVAVSAELAKSSGLNLGDSFLMPTPTGMRKVRYVATISNYGWQAGAVTMGGETFVRAWGSREMTMAGVQLAPGANAAEARAGIERALGPQTPLRIETPIQGEARAHHNVVLGLTRLKQIAATILLGAVLAVTASCFAAIAQRRRRIACLRAIGISTGQVLAALTWEIGLALAVGAAAGATLGFAAQWLFVTGFSAEGYPIRLAADPQPFAVALAAVALLVVSASAVATSYAMRQPIAPALTTD